MDSKENSGQTSWDYYWKQCSKTTFWNKNVNNQLWKILQDIIGSLDLSVDSRIIDFGCGEGKTLTWLRHMGFKNSIGIDQSSSALNLCSRKELLPGRDVFLMNAGKTTFKDNEFQLCFSEGMLEHLTDFTPAISEMCRISQKYVLIEQPDHNVFLGRVIEFIRDNIRRIHWLQNILGASICTIKEYSYRPDDYISCFNKCGFTLKFQRRAHFNEIFLLLFEKTTSH